MSMSWYWAVLCTLGVIGFWAAVWMVGDLLSSAWQTRMSATLWKSLPAAPGPVEGAPRGEE